MATYKNTRANFEADCTVIAFAQGKKPTGENWVECEESEIIGFQLLYIQAGTRFFGVL